VSVSASGNGSDKGKEEEELVQSFAATGIDNAIDLLETINAKTDKASVGQQAAGLERHPEVSAVSFWTADYEGLMCLV
jgi:hypothetical protein